MLITRGNASVSPFPAEGIPYVAALTGRRKRGRKTEQSSKPMSMFVNNTDSMTVAVAQKIVRSKQSCENYCLELKLKNCIADRLINFSS